MSDDALAHASLAARLAREQEVLRPLGERFATAGHEVAIVGGWVRDALLGRTTGAADLDLATSARPEEVLALLSGWAEALWDVGVRFGTVGARVAGQRVEITTYRTETYDPSNRHPDVVYGTDLVGDLSRRDFTVNAMAIRLPSLEFVDPFGGLVDLERAVLRTPGSPESSFDDDPLRMMRAARFAAQLRFAVDPEALAAMSAMAERLQIVSAERVQDELTKLLLADDPRTGLTILVDTGLAAWILPELPLLKLEIDEHHRHKDVYEHSLTVLEQAIDLERSHEPASEPDLVLRLAALLHDIGKPKTRRFEGDGRVSFHHHDVVGARMCRKRLEALRYSTDIIDSVSSLVDLHLRFHGYGDGEWTDSAVRRYVRDAGDQLVRLHKLTRADCTTRNRRRADGLRRSYDSLEARIAELAEQEEIQAIRPDLDGTAIMAILGVPPGPVVGEAYRYLLDLRLDSGPMSAAEAEQQLRAWWAERTS